MSPPTATTAVKKTLETDPRLTKKTRQNSKRREGPPRTHSRFSSQVSSIQYSPVDNKKSPPNSIEEALAKEQNRKNTKKCGADHRGQGLVRPAPGLLHRGQDNREPDVHNEWISFAGKPPKELGKKRFPILTQSVLSHMRMYPLEKQNEVEPT